MRIYIGNVEIAGYFTKLKKGFDEEGIKADLWFLCKNKYYQSPMPLMVVINQWLFELFKNGKNPLIKWLALPFLMATKSLIFCWVCLRYDVFILNSHAYFQFHELAILKYFRKKIIFVCLGTESRPQYMSGNFVLSRYMKGNDANYDACYRDVEKQKKEFERIEKYADVIINHPPTALFHSKPFIAWMHIGFPCGDESNSIDPRNERSRLLKILHAPSLALSKGSAEIEAMVRKIQESGYPVEFVRLENVPNERVIEMIKEADIIIDELYSDIPLGGLGTEASYANKPVVSAGYYAACMHFDYSTEDIPPSVFCLPEELEHELLDLVLNRTRRLEVGEKSGQFVRKNWNNRAVARKYLDIINGHIPQSWYFDPLNIQCINGYGMQEDKLKKFVAGYVRLFGKEALFLNHNEGLQEKLLNFINENKEIFSERKVS